jgi:hypothetical protein
MKLAFFLFVMFFSLQSAKALPIEFAARVSSGKLQFVDQLDFEKYVEAEVYAQYYFSNMFALRLGGFGRFSDEQNYGGAQFAAPLILDVNRLGLSTYMAPGYRYMNRGLSAPTLESGLNLKMLGDIGIGYRLILNEWVNNGLKTEGQFFVSVGF